MTAPDSRVTVGHNDDGTLDEVVGTGDFHLEQMDANAWWVQLGPHMVWLRARGKITAHFGENEALARGPQQAGGEDGLRCLDCGKAYAGFPLDVVLPDDQWQAIAGGPGGVLCAACIVERGSRLPGVTVAKLYFPDLSDPLREAGRDAARYRFLRDPIINAWEPQPAAWIEFRGNEYIESDWLTGELADAAIDAALNGGQDDA